MSHSRSILAVLAWILIALVATSTAQKSVKAEPDATTATPESVGFSTQRLDRLHALIQDEVDEKQLAGAVTILARHGKIIDYRTYGQRDIASGAPMIKDAIFRDYSMTKPITGAAMMILYEQGKWLPSDPISKFIPEFRQLKVYAGKDADGKMILVDPDHAPTMGELMSHTAGFTYGFADMNDPVNVMYREQKVMGSKNLQEMVDKLAKIPLLYQPGKGWAYSVSMDIEGYIIEKLSGHSLPDFVHDEITAPLGMVDAGFFVPAAKRSRFAALYKTGTDGTVVLTHSDNTYNEMPTLASGGGGMVSSAEDYYRFAQMLLNGGEFDGTRLLAPSSVKLMSSNHVPADLLNGHFGIGRHVMRPGFGYGFNCAVVFDPPAAELPVGKGTFFWDGAAGTWFWIDPTNDIVFVAMIQRMTSPDNHVLLYRSQSVVYQALIDPKK
jgi:CubicO group peptidase (beta-lactamase class C family)